MIQESARNRHVRLPQIIRNLFSNYTYLGLTVAVAIFLTPILFHYLGTENYAILVFALSIPAFFEVFDFGMTGTMTRYVSELEARGDYSNLQGLANSIFFLLLGFGAATSALLLIMTREVADFFKLQNTPQSPVYITLALVSLCVMFEPPGTVLRGYLEGCQDFHLENAVDILTVIFRSALIVILFVKGYGLAWVAAVFPVSSLLHFFGMLAVARKATVRYSPRWIKPNLWTLKEVASFASLTFLQSSTARWYSQAPNFLAARLLSLPDLAILSVARRFPQGISHIVESTLSVAYPIVSAAAARGERALLRKYLLISTRNILALAVPLAMACYLWADAILVIWIGPEVLSGVFVLRALLVYAVFASVQQIPVTLLNGIGRPRTSALLSLGTLVSGVVLGGWACSFGTLSYFAVVFSLIQLAATLILFHLGLKTVHLSLKTLAQVSILPVVWASMPAGALLWCTATLLRHTLMVIVLSCAAGMLLFIAVYSRLILTPGRRTWRIWSASLLVESKQLVASEGRRAGGDSPL